MRWSPPAMMTQLSISSTYLPSLRPPRGQCDDNRSFRQCPARMAAQHVELDAVLGPVGPLSPDGTAHQDELADSVCPAKTTRAHPLEASVEPNVLTNRPFPHPLNKRAARKGMCRATRHGNL